jgi:sulfhydrogenase subunit beta (sulfur reductase)
MNKKDAYELVISLAGLEELVAALKRRDFKVIGPKVRDGSIVYAELESAADLPAGWTDEQAPGSYRLARRDDEARFGFAAGPHSWKQYLLPPRVRIWRANRNGKGLEIKENAQPERQAFLGVRGCDLGAIAIQDRVLMGGRYVDRDYAARRDGIFVIAVDCGDPASTCFCASMGTGPAAEGAYDLALTELLTGEHRFLVRVGSERGAEVLGEVSHRPVNAADRDHAVAVIEHARRSMGRSLDTDGLHDSLLQNLEHPRWDEVAERCLSCGNCTQVCPTCFCTGVEDAADLTGDMMERTRVWNTCFSLDHSYVHGGSVRPSGRSRYRQWLTHKLATWEDQFGTSGCVGCGRCIAWCPVGIDITEEAAALSGGAEGASHENA